MSIKKISIINIFTVLILIAMPVSSTHSDSSEANYAKGLNGLLNGVYAQNEQWACNASEPPLQLSCPAPECRTEQTTATGRITYDGNGGARGIGRFSYTNHTTPFGDIGTYDCDWVYKVIDSLTFEYSGTCEVRGGGGSGPPVFLTNQKWFGQIGNKGEILLVERHDIPVLNFPPEDWEGTGNTRNVSDILERVCGKTGVQIKIQ